jgi:general secretion pathway protein N
VNPWRGLAIGLGAYAVALFAYAPATLVDAALQRASHGTLRLAQAEGTLWSGSGQIEIREAGGRTGVSKSLSWHLVPESVLRGHLVCEVGLDPPAVFFPLTISLTRIELANADISLPATVLGMGIPKLAPLGLTGDVLIHVARLSVARGTMQGNATLRWHGAGSILTTVSPLGDYEVHLEGADTTFHAVLRSIEGPLWLDGNGSWQQGSNPEFLATAHVDPPYREQLAPLLRLIAVERSEGSFALELK